MPLPPHAAAASFGAAPLPALSADERAAWLILERGLLGYQFGPTLVDGILVPFYCGELGVIVAVGAGEERRLPSAERLAELKLRVARVGDGLVNRAELVSAIEMVVGRGRLWPED